VCVLIVYSIHTMSEVTAIKRVNISLDDDVLTMGREVADAEHRAFSNAVAVLIREKHAALVKEGKIQPKVEVVS
jgi:folate-dependent phosphoribosylglycinamide formyltransferase PurN